MRRVSFPRGLGWFTLGCVTRQKRLLMTSRTKAWLIYGGLVLLIVLMIIGTIGIGLVTRGGARNIRPGAETTVITEPVRDDGMIDYLTAINQLASVGVRPGANAAVDMLRAFGPTVLPNDRRSRYYAELGMRPLPLEGNYFIGLDAYAANALLRQQRLARRMQTSNFNRPRARS